MKWLVLLIFSVSVIACSSSPSPAAKEVLSSPLPTATAVAGPTSIPVTPLNLSGTETFTHSSQLFAIKYPTAWQIVERDNGVVALSPANRIGLTVVFTNGGESYTRAELEQYLLGFIAQNFDQDGADFKALSLEQRADGSITADFSVNDPEFDRVVSQAKVLQQDGVIFLVYSSAPETLWQAYSEPLRALVNSLVPLDNAGLQTSTPEAPVWALVGPESKEFGFLVADDWQLVSRDQNQVSVVSPSGKMTFTASNFAWPDAVANPQAAEEVALAHLAELTKVFTDVQHLPPTEFPLDTTTGVTIDFVYIDADGQLVAGSVITGVGNGKMHKIEFTAPTDFYDAALDWFNPMYKSFKFLSPDLGLDD